MTKPRHYWQCRNEKTGEIAGVRETRTEAIDTACYRHSEWTGSAAHRNLFWNYYMKLWGWKCVKVYVMTEEEMKENHCGPRQTGFPKLILEKLHRQFSNSLEKARNTIDSLDEDVNRIEIVHLKAKISAYFDILQWLENKFYSCHWSKR